jgi:thiol-disulfide isomerase/thioredoxin
MDARLKFRFVRSIAGLALVVVWILIACQLPEKLVAAISGSKHTGTAVSILASASTAPKTTLTPGNATQTSFPGVGSPEIYPGVGTEQPALTATAQTSQGAAYPGAGGQNTDTSTPASTQPNPSSEPAYPAQSTTYPGPLQANVTDIALTLTAIIYPDSGVEGPFAPGQNPTQTSGSAYPGVVTDTPSVPSSESYPGPGSTSPTPSQTNIGATATATGRTPTPTSTTSGAKPAAGVSSFTPTSSPVFAGTPTQTSTPVMANTPTPSPSATQFVIPTTTPTSTRTPFLTPTASLTRTPTITPSPLPAPPWVSSQLRATNPRMVQLASGRVQLVEFFAFWSGTSQAMAPILHGLEDQYGAQMNFIYLDIDDPANTYFKCELGFRMEPHFFLLDPQGKVLRQWIGYVNREQFIPAFDAALGQ